MKNIKLAALTVSLLASQGVFAKGIEVSLNTGAESITAKEDLSVSVTFTNTENKPLQLLNWYLPESNIKESLFTIKRDGEYRHYFGAHAKRSAPQRRDYIELQPNESVSYQMELSGLYDLSQTGSYDIQYSVEYTDLIRNGGKSSLSLENNRLITDKIQEASTQLESNVINVWIEGRGDNFLEVSRQAPSDYTTQGISYSGSCTNSEKNTLVSALSAASGIANNSASYLQNEAGNQNGDRYDTWFGNYSSNNWNTVRENFVEIKDAIDTQNITFDCSCNDNYYAYVYPSQPYVVYMCNAFWAAPMTGTDSKAGTIIHEISHFNVVAGTDDLAYGQSAAMRLKAKRAIRNADSHEYFAENTPYQN